MKIGIGGLSKNSERKYKFFGKWYKPWTWFNWKKVTIIKEFELIEFSFVTNPVNKECRIKK